MTSIPKCRKEEIDGETSGILFRVLQEGLTNVIRHAGATAVEVGLAKEAGHIVMRIRDNGKLTFDQPVDEGFGLKTMKSRLEERGGRLRYAHAEPHGFELEAALPVNRRRQGDGSGEEEG